MNPIEDYFKPDHMKKFTFALLLLVAYSSYGQCEFCNSLEEALKKPEMVRSLKINPYTNKVPPMDSLPASIGSFPNLEVLYLTGHNFTSLPVEIGNLKKLRDLSFSECKLTWVPHELFSLTGLKGVILMDNKFPDDYKKYLRKMFDKHLPYAKVLL
jgi:hypothetical protein